MSSQGEAQHTTSRGGRGARGRILETAVELFYREGINATGVERLANHASVSKRTLYQHFPSKTVLVEEYLSTIRSAYEDAKEQQSDGAEESPRARLLALFDSPTAGDGLMRGCPFHNAAVEAAEDMPGVHRIVRAHKQNFIDGMAELAHQAGAADARRLGNQLGVLYEGAAALATSLNDPAPWADAQAAARTLIDHAIG